MKKITIIGVIIGTAFLALVILKLAEMRKVDEGCRYVVTMQDGSVLYGVSVLPSRDYITIIDTTFNVITVSRYGYQSYKLECKKDVTKRTD